MKTKSHSIEPFRPPQDEPCKDCPFRRQSMPGWLGGDRPEGFVANVLAEVPLPCHLTIDYEQPDWHAQWTAGKTGKLCTGALIFAANCGKRPRLQSRLPVVEADREHVFADGKEFIEHHRSLGVGSWNENEALPSLRCHFCNDAIGDDYYCFGCQVAVCDRCDRNDDLPCGPHDPAAHNINA